MYWLHLFDLSPLCVFKCSLKLPVWKDSKVHWLHLFDFSPLWVLRCWLEELGSEQAKSHWTFLQGFFQSLPMHNHISCICFAFFTASFQMSPLSKLKWDVIKVSLIAFAYSMCVFICVLKVPARLDAYSHWLHLFEFSPLWSFKWVYKTTAQEDGILRWLHMFCFYPLCIFKWLFKLPVLEYA